MMKKLLIPSFILLVIIQWVVPGQMIWKEKSIAMMGTDYKFRTEPVDPVNPFVGRYIVLRFRDQQHTVPVKQAPDNEEEVYVTFKKNKHGFAVIDQITNTAPERKDYLKTTVYNVSEDKDGVSLTVHYPFNRFYMEESKAPRAEIAYRSWNLDTAAKVYALVAIYKGDAVTKDVFVNDTSIATMLSNRR